MATACCSIPSITEVFGIYSLGNHELRLYRTCKVIHDCHQVRRDWWRYTQVADSLAWHLNPSKVECAWESFFAWRGYVHGDPLPVTVPTLRPFYEILEVFPSHKMIALIKLFGDVP